MEVNFSEILFSDMKILSMTSLIFHKEFLNIDWSYKISKRCFSKLRIFLHVSLLLNPMGFNNGVESHAHHHGSVQSCYVILRTSCLFIFHPPVTRSMDLFYVSRVLPLLESYINETIQYVTFWTWLLLLSHKSVGFFHTFVWISSSLSIILSNISMHGCSIVCSSIHLLMDMWIMSVFW